MDYTLADIQDAWESYSTRQVLKYTINGERYLLDLTGQAFTAPQGAIRPEIVKASSVYSFPEFLEKKWKKT